MNWDDPAARLHLIDRVGLQEYNRQIEEHNAKSVVQTVNGHAIRPVLTRFGRVFAVGATGKAFATLAEATAFAREQPCQS
jgi:ribosomal protein L12E/L44/L45/RPP1/RPP2